MGRKQIKAEPPHDSDGTEQGPAASPITTPPSPSPDAEKSLDELRLQINDVDRQVVALLNHRAALAVSIGAVKRKLGLEIWSPARESEVLDRVLASSKGPLPEDLLRNMFRELMSASRKLQQRIQVACLGPDFSYSHLAVLAKFGDSVEHVPVSTITGVFEEVNKKRVEYGIVPLENSTDGRIADTLDMFVKLPHLKIRAEVRLRIHHCLAARCELSQVRQVYSRAQPLSQCRHWLSKHLPRAALIESLSSPAAAERAHNEEFAAAIASRHAARAYGLNILAKNIEDQHYNVTRFAVISDRYEEATGNDKTTIMMKVGNRPGALVNALEPFLSNAVNMTWIESFPDVTSNPDRDPAYLFFIDIEGHSSHPKIKAAIDAVTEKTQQLEVLGSYPKSVCYDD